MEVSPSLLNVSLTSQGVGTERSRTHFLVSRVVTSATAWRNGQARTYDL